MGSIRSSSVEFVSGDHPQLNFVRSLTRLVLALGFILLLSGFSEHEEMNLLDFMASCDADGLLAFIFGSNSRPTQFPCSGEWPSTGSPIMVFSFLHCLLIYALHLCCFLGLLWS
jgi:hypothetical protein